VLLMRSLGTRKKAPQTVKTGLKQGVNRVKRQISLPNANRLKNRCSHGRKQIRKNCIRMQIKIRNTQNYKSTPQSAEAVRTRYIKKSVGTKSAVSPKKSA